MTVTAERESRIRRVSAIAPDSNGRLLPVRRRNPPGEGLWSRPRGRAGPGESDETALVREPRAHPRLSVTTGASTGSVTRPAPGGAHGFHDAPARCDPASSDRAGTRWTRGGPKLRSWPHSHWTRRCEEPSPDGVRLPRS
ncbi:NUDIX domain-containing protein [Saccharothrix saharensis]|uniref:NUDIX domain-containing protein n=1 Tax=Saccharothrix saharensis TaxID=571190 RepID=UPI001478875C